MKRSLVTLVGIGCLIAPAMSRATTTDATTTPPAEIVTPTPIVTTPGAVTLSPVAQTRIRNLAANLSNREDAAVRRLENVSARLDSRLKIFEGNGMDMSSARTHLTEATAALATAKQNLDGIDAAVNTFVGSSNPREYWTTLKGTYSDTATTIQAAYDALVLALAQAENPGMQTPTEAATTTSTTSTNR